MLLLSDLANKQRFLTSDVLNKPGYYVLDSFKLSAIIAECEESSMFVPPPAILAHTPILTIAISCSGWVGEAVDMSLGTFLSMHDLDVSYRRVILQLMSSTGLQLFSCVSSVAQHLIRSRSEVDLAQVTFFFLSS